MENNKITLILVLLFLSTISGSNITNLSEDGKIIPWKKSQHKYAMFWRCHSLLGLVGTGFNSFILYLFVREAVKKKKEKIMNLALFPFRPSLPS